MRREVRARTEPGRLAIEYLIFDIRRGGFELSVKLNSAEKELHVEVLQEKEGGFLNYFFKLFT